MSNACTALHICGEELLLHPQRAVVWPARRTIIVADTHFGKTAMFRRHGMAVPMGSDEFDRQRLSSLAEETSAQRLIVLGDFFHAVPDGDSEEASELDAWCRSLAIEIHVVRGNHDRGTLPCRPRLIWHDQLSEPPFRFIHDVGQLRACAAHGFAMSGHIHPVIRLRGLRKRAPRIPVFWQRKADLVLPSFGIFTGGFVVSPGPLDRIFAAGPQRVVRLR